MFLHLRDLFSFYSFARAFAVSVFYIFAAHATAAESVELRAPGESCYWMQCCRWHRILMTGYYSRFVLLCSFATLRHFLLALYMDGILRPVNPGMDFDSTIFFALCALNCVLYFYHFQYFRIFGKICILSNINFTPLYLFIHWYFKM